MVLTREAVGGVPTLTWPDPSDVFTGWVDVERVLFNASLGFDDDGKVVEGATQPYWRIEVAAEPPLSADVEPELVTAYGLALETTGDGVADYLIGIDNEAPERGDFRVWLTDLAASETDEKIGPPYGWPIEFVHPDELQPDQRSPDEGPVMMFTFLDGGPADLNLEEVRFYVWTSVTRGDEILASDFAPDEGWLTADSRTLWDATPRPQTTESEPGSGSIPSGDGPIEPGTYRIPKSDWSVTDFTVAFPAGWTVQYGHVYANGGNGDDEVGFYPVVVDEIFAEGCAGSDSGVIEVGPSVDDLAEALLHQSGSSKNGPFATTLGGHPATRIDLTVPEDFDLASCNAPDIGLRIWYSAPADKNFVLLDKATASVYILDVNGVRQVFLTQYGRTASEEDRAELQAVLRSIRIEGLGAPVERFAESER
jgi:hypothetical protein